MVGGNLNITLVDFDRSGNRCGRDLSSSRFWEWINGNSLIEMDPADVKYTWHGSNSRSRIDRFFISVEAASLFLAAFCWSWEQPLSDHTPFIWEDGSQSAFKYCFRILRSWLQDPLFIDIMTDSWTRDIDAPTTTAKITLKLSRLRSDVLTFREDLKRLSSANRTVALSTVRDLDLIEDLDSLSSIQQQIRKDALLTLHQLDAAVESD